MGLEIKKFLRTKDKDGADVLLEADKPLAAFYEGTTADGATAIIKHGENTLHEIDVSFICDGPSCAGSDGTGPTKLTWHESKDQGAPVAAKQILVLALTDGQRFMFCGGGCVIDFIKKGRHRLVEVQKAPVTNIAEFKKEEEK